MDDPAAGKEPTSQLDDDFPFWNPILPHSAASGWLGSW
jgi:hypothetical protein